MAQFPLPLEDGERMTRLEFERRFDATPGLKLAELIDGIVHTHPRVKRGHGRANAHLLGWIGQYAACTPGVEGGCHAHVRLDAENEPQPDGLLFIKPECGGRTRIDADDILETLPDLVAEVVEHAGFYDLGAKKDVYERFGAREYVVWRTRDRQIEWFVLRDGRYESMSAADGILRSQVFPGLWLDPEAFSMDDPARLIAIVSQGLKSPEHAAFVAKLEAAKARDNATDLA